MLNKTITFIAMMVLSLTNQAQAASPYQTLEITQFEVPGNIGLPLDFNDNLLSDLVSEISRTKAFAQVYRSGAGPSGGTKTSLRLSGRITQFQRGNRTMRYMVGFGAGKTVLKADIEFIDAETGKVVLQRSVDGKVVMGLLGGESMGATRGVAKEVAKLAKQSFH